MSVPELEKLAAEMRAALIRKVSETGGHVGPNLGMVEAIIALHYVFDAPEDKIVFDVSHQSYPHKMLTGRMEAFIDPEHYRDVTGYTAPSESPYDLFSVGHTSTSVSMASGLAKARDLRGGKENVVAVIGDASLGGGMAFEGMDFAATLGSNFIVVVNDNDMSIAENHGALYADLRMLRHTNGEGEPNFFRSIGFSYRYVNYGNSLPRLIEAFKAVKDIDHPVVVHINTMKGLGLKPAEVNKEAFHWSMPFDPKSGALRVEDNAENYSDIFATHMLDRMAEDKNIATITAGTPGTLGFTPERRRAAGRQFIDVGICEQQGVAMTGAMAKGGARAVMGVASPFLQRAYDQFSHDVGINCLAGVYTVFFAGLYALNDETHLGFFDVALLNSVPNFRYLAPTCKEEFIAMLDWAIDQNSVPAGIRTPSGAVVSNPDCELLKDYKDAPYMIGRKGKDVAIIGVGPFYNLALQAADIMQKNGITPTVINPRSYSHLDTKVLDSLKDYRLVITAEDNILEGGLGRQIAQYLADAPVTVKCLGLPKRFLNRFRASEIAKQCGLTPQQIADMAQ